MSLLSVDRCTVAFGGLVALDAMSMNIEEGEIVGLIGPNGAGKTTVFNLITGVCRSASFRSATAEIETDKAASDFRRRVKVHHGDMTFCGRSIRDLAPHEIAARGIARTFQNIRLFPDLSVFDNVRAACHVHARTSLASAILRTRAFGDEEHDIDKRATHLLHVFGLGEFRNELASSLPYGEQRRLEIARALATNPRLLLLDEPAAGMNPHETRELTELIGQVREDFKLTVFLIEHDMKVVMGICERIYVLDYGEIIAYGVPSQIKSDPKVIQAYLGEE
jgi:branched-chain amino acid transport system ATP-binding protein